MDPFNQDMICSPRPESSISAVSMIPMQLGSIQRLFLPTHHYQAFHWIPHLSGSPLDRLLTHWI